MTGAPLGHSERSVTVVGGGGGGTAGQRLPLPHEKLVSNCSWHFDIKGPDVLKSQTLGNKTTEPSHWKFLFLSGIFSLLDPQGGLVGSGRARRTPTDG